MNITEIENHFLHQQKLLGNLADHESFTMIFSLIDNVRTQGKEIDRLTALNRHYFFKFYDGSIEKMKADCKYLMDT